VTEFLRANCLLNLQVSTLVLASLVLLFDIFIILFFIYGHTPVLTAYHSNSPTTASTWTTKSPIQSTNSYGQFRFVLRLYIRLVRQSANVAHLSSQSCFVYSRVLRHTYLSNMYYIALCI
jgi:hypothetical protein